jgi:methionyl-tRNA formyltransferase
MAGGQRQGLKQDKNQVTKAPKLTKEHGLIDWNRPAAAVVNHIRAMQPWPTAYTFWRRSGQPALRLLILKARALSDAARPVLPPGEVIMQPDIARLLVAAAPGSQVEILELQPAGKRRMTTVEFLRGRKAQPGDSLGTGNALT